MAVLVKRYAEIVVVAAFTSLVVIFADRISRLEVMHFDDWVRGFAAGFVGCAVFGFMTGN